MKILKAVKSRVCPGRKNASDILPLGWQRCLSLEEERANMEYSKKFTQS
jgi:hypothetical protein